MKLLTTLASKTVCGTVGRLQDLRLGRFPRLVRIETTSACNACCTICPHSEMRRPVQRMGDELYQQIIDECAENSCREVHLHNFGEPLMDPSLAQRVAYAKERGVPKVKIFCNGSLLDEERARALIEAGLDEIKVSFDGATAEEFESIRTPLKFDVVVRNIKRTVAIRDELGSPMRIKIACCSTSDRTGTMDVLARSVDGFSFGKVHNWGDQDYGRQKQGVRKPCSRVWRTFTVLASGDVGLCCLDYDGQVILGHIDPAHTIRDIYRSPAYQDIRRKHRTARQDQLTLCAECTKAYL